MAKTIQSIKVWVRKEEERLQQRTLDKMAVQESMSLAGSLLTIRKVMRYLEEK